MLPLFKPYISTLVSGALRKSLGYSSPRDKTISSPAEIFPHSRQCFTGPGVSGWRRQFSRVRSVSHQISDLRLSSGKNPPPTPGWGESEFWPPWGDALREFSGTESFVLGGTCLRGWWEVQEMSSRCGVKDRAPKKELCDEGGEKRGLCALHSLSVFFPSAAAIAYKTKLEITSGTYKGICCFLKKM
ncbi:hypothetical protein CDAR_205561 [Caerostris darwini]|uniref:Uncharacterized protein n=1 Tax=Caerostris darwini TaxID=1538125 RepID=A0AAV4WT24_9ARAC|nr:hypothetical protein CDAR_205561 [Caerostris darwini]